MTVGDYGLQRYAASVTGPVNATHATKYLHGAIDDILRHLCSHDFHHGYVRQGHLHTLLFHHLCGLHNQQTDLLTITIAQLPGRLKQGMACQGTTAIHSVPCRP